MSATPVAPRSPELMSRHDTALLVVDVQTRLLDAMAPPPTLVWNIRRLIDGAQVLGVPVAATEQYPRGTGANHPELAERLGEIPAKLMFSCRECGEIFERWREQGIYKILVVGIETHVCVQQTVLDLLAAGFQVYVAVDAVGSRFAVDRDTALRRMESSGATLTTTEAALFEWCEVAGTPEFKTISALVRETPPPTDLPASRAGLNNSPRLMLATACWHCYIALALSPRFACLVMHAPVGEQHRWLGFDSITRSRRMESPRIECRCSRQPRVCSQLPCLY